MRIRLCSVLVDDQRKALDFYTRVLGFQKKTEVPAGEYLWLTVVSPEEPDGPELLLEPNAHPAGKAYQQALYRDRIPAAAFFVEDVGKEYQRLTRAGVKFQSEPHQLPDGPKIAVFDDTCGNWIQLVEG